MIPNDEWRTVQILNPMLHPDPQKEKRLLLLNQMYTYTCLRRNAEMNTSINVCDFSGCLGCFTHSPQKTGDNAFCRTAG